MFFSCVITMLLVTGVASGGGVQLCDHLAVGYSVASGGVFSVVGSVCFWIQVLPVMFFVCFFRCVITMLLVTGVASGDVLQLCDHAVGYRCCQWWCSSAV